MEKTDLKWLDINLHIQKYLSSNIDEPTEALDHLIELLVGLINIFWLVHDIDVLQEVIDDLTSWVFEIRKNPELISRKAKFDKERFEKNPLSPHGDSHEDKDTNKDGERG